MKFTRYLEDTQTPEWKRAYIDYRIFKERIRAIRRVQDGMALPVDSYSNSQLNHQAGSMLSVIVQSESGENSPATSSVNWPERDRSPSPPRVRTEGRSRPLLERGPPLHGTRTPQNDAPPSPGGLAPRNPSRPPFERRLSLHRTHTSQSNVTPPSPGGAAAPNTGRPPIERRISLDPTPSPPSPGGVAATTTTRRPKITLPQLIVRQPTNRSSITRQWTNNSMARQGDTIPPSPAIPPLTPASRVFKGLSHLIGPSRHPYSELSLHALIPLLSPQELAFFAALDSELQKVETFYVDRENAMKIRTRDLEVQLRELNEHRRLFDAAHPETLGPHIFNATQILGFLRRLPFVGAEKPAVECVQVESETIDVPSGHKMDEKQAETGRGQEHLDPKAYLYARRKLKKAVLEHYRGLEMLHNYRVLNIYGFRRVLNKFEKATKIPAQRAYMEEKVEKSAFSSDETLRTMMEDMQNVFAASFAETERRP
ncbi:SPX domain-containing protein [Mycena metata]|uniref:SPX domain-containing protein n=1 Tax=Mycena metata TaxID=1033252 RepID=A0AAD7K4K2_9AGAR|nr:SPX domain-containing protein [Mycena metata]